MLFYAPTQTGRLSIKWEIEHKSAFKKATRVRVGADGPLKENGPVFVVFVCFCVRAFKSLRT